MQNAAESTFLVNLFRKRDNNRSEVRPKGQGIAESVRAAGGNHIAASGPIAFSVLRPADILSFQENASSSRGR